MSTQFVIADPHFGHKGVTHFTRSDGTPLRPWDDVEEMDEDMVRMWNDTVGPKDKVYVLGDFCINRKALPIAARLNGDKVLIKGNHDIFKLEDYTPYFRDIRACHVINKAILTHIPVHPDQLHRFGHNIHGHLHSNVVKYEIYLGGAALIRTDPRYICVSVEHTDFRPIPLDSILKRL